MAAVSPSSMDRWKGCVALVTGASSGIGAAICRELVKYGITVVGVARSVGKIHAISREEAVDQAPGHLFGFKCDLTNEDEILAVFQKIREDFGRIDICINNAGFSSNTSLMTGRTEDWRDMIDSRDTVRWKDIVCWKTCPAYRAHFPTDMVNVLALCICTREALKLMSEKKINTGQIIHIGSLSGHRIPSSNASFYAGTKFMVRALAEGLRQELKAANSKIRVASISPGLVETGFAHRMLEDPDKAQELYSSIHCLQSSDIAEAVVYILSTSPRVDINDILIRPVEQLK